MDRSGFNLTLDLDTDTFNLTLDPDTGGNAIAFESGDGDGSYASYWGFTADDELACLVTDFKVLLDYIMQDIEIEEVMRFLEKSIEHPDFERLEVAIRLSRHRPSWVQLSDDSLNDQPSNPDGIVVLEGQGRQPWSVELEPGGRYSGCLMMASEWIEEDRWYREYWFNEPLQANAVLKMTVNSEVYPLQPVTTNA